MTEETWCQCSEQTPAPTTEILFDSTATLSISLRPASQITVSFALTELKVSSFDINIQQSQLLEMMDSAFFFVTMT